MPNLSDTFKTVNRQYQSVSGRNLKPEEGWNYELGYKHITNKDSWKVAAFYMDFKNFFSWKPDSNGKMTIRVNGGRFRNVGVEAQYGRKLTDRLKVTVGAAYSNPKQRKSIKIIGNKPIQNYNLQGAFITIVPLGQLDLV